MEGYRNGLKAEVGRSKLAIENIASSWRLRLGYDPTDAVDVARLFEFQLATVQLPSRKGAVELFSHVQPCQDEGLTKWDCEHERLELILSDASYRGLLNGASRPKFTVCHEFGHAVLHTDELIRLAGYSDAKRLSMYRTSAHEVYYDSEWQANHFAAAFLMPVAGIETLRQTVEITAQMIAHRYKVSLATAQIRLERLAK